ncbi:unnamed protein product [Penicillium glandicola]
MTTLTDPTNATRATPNLTAEKSVLKIGSSTFISAPSEEVWAALTDTSTWPSWNTFVPRVTIRSQPTPNPSPSTSAPDPTPAEPTSTSAPQSTNTNTTLSPILQKGTKLTFHVRMDTTSTKPKPASDVYLLISEYRAPNTETGEVGRIVWVIDTEAPGAFSPSLLTAEREHEITPVEGGTELQANLEMWVADLKGFVEGGSHVVSS